MYLDHTYKPESLPEFATENMIDTVTGKNNVVEPETSQKKYGWHPFRRLPERNVFNWLHRHTYNFLKYLSDDLFNEVNDGLTYHETRITNLESSTHIHNSGTVHLSLQAENGYFLTSADYGTLVTGQIHFDMDYQIFNKAVIFTYQDGAPGTVRGLVGGTVHAISGVNTFTIRVVPSSYWPTYLNTSAFYQYCVAHFQFGLYPALTQTPLFLDLYNNFTNYFDTYLFTVTIPETLWGFESIFRMYLHPLYYCAK